MLQFSSISEQLEAPMNARSAGVSAPSVACVTQSEVEASIPPEGIKPNQLIPMFKHRIRDEKEFVDWVTACAKWDPKSNILRPRAPPQRNRPDTVLNPVN